MKRIFLLPILCLIMVSNVFCQNDDILCTPCIQSLIASNQIIDVQMSHQCPTKVIFIKANGQSLLRYKNDICTVPIAWDYQYCDDYYSIGTQCNSSYSCDVQVEMIQGVECVLPRIVNTGVILNPCSYSFGVAGLDGSIGTKYLIGYTAISGCFSTCQQGLPINVNCVNLITPPVDNDFEYCTGFESYTIGNISPQGSPQFTLFSNMAAQQASVVAAPSYIGNRSLKFINGANVDFNISRTLAEDRVARLDWQLYIEEGKTGAFGLETNNANRHAFWVEMEASSMSVWGWVNNVPTKLSIDQGRPLNSWIHFAVIFQPSKNKIELWSNSKLIHTVTDYTSNKIEDLNFYSITGKQNTTYYIDQLCYKEWSSTVPCTNDFVPVCVDNQSFSNACRARLAGYSEDEIYMGSCGGPGCPQLTAPVGSPIPINTQIRWTAVDKVILYLLTVNVNGVVWFENKNVGNKTFYNLTDLPYGATVDISINAVNSSAVNGCFFYSFQTIANLLIPQCVEILSPLSNAQNLDVDVNFQWRTSTNATGYRLKLGTSIGGNDLLDIKLGNVTSRQVGNLPYDQTIYVTVIPLNAAGEAQNCTSLKFTTKKEHWIPSCTQLTSPFNNEQNVPTTLNILWSPANGATGYHIDLKNASGSQILGTITVGDVSNYILYGLPANTFVCVTVSPLNSAGEAKNCSPTCFKTVLSSSTNQQDLGTISITPNPSGGLFYLHDQYQNEGSGSLVIYNNLGQVVGKKADYHLNEPIELYTVPSGIYRVVFTTAKSHKVHQLIKQ